MGEELAQWQAGAAPIPTRMFRSLEASGLLLAQCYQKLLCLPHPYVIVVGDSSNFLALGKVLLHKSATAYSDEPTKGLDAPTKDAVVNLLLVHSQKVQLRNSNARYEADIARCR